MKDMELSHLSKVAKGTESIKTTIPKNIVKAMKLTIEDVLEWRLEDKKGEKIACVHKLKTS